MISGIKNIGSVIKKIITQELDKRKVLDIFIVTEVFPETFTANIRNYWFGRLQYDNVQISGIGLGNLNGIIKLPKVNDMVLVGYISPKQPIILSSLFTPNNGRLIETDLIPRIKEGETLIIGNTKGSYIFMDIDGNILIQSDSIKLAGKDGAAIARVGDTVSVNVTAGSSTGTYAGTITSGSDKVTSE